MHFAVVCVDWARQTAARDERAEPEEWRAHDWRDFDEVNNQFTTLFISAAAAACRQPRSRIAHSNKTQFINSYTPDTIICNIIDIKSYLHEIFVWTSGALSCTMCMGVMFVWNFVDGF